MTSKQRRYVIVPDDNVFNDKMETTSFQLFRSLHKKLFNGTSIKALSSRHDPEAATSQPLRPPLRILETEAGKIRLIDSIDLNEASLVSMTPDQAFLLQRIYPSLRVRPELTLYPLRYGQANLVRQQAKPSAFRSEKELVLRCVDQASGKPIAGASLVILLNQKRGFGISDVETDAEGWFRTALPTGQTSIDAIICAPLADHWPGAMADIKVSESGETKVELALTAIADDYLDGLARMVAPAKSGDGQGVKVAVVDTGVSRAPGLNIVQGLNTTGTEPADEWTDNGTGHGTHCAGIVARIAPKVELFAYRVFEKGDGGASEFSIARAIRQAVDDGCDIINLSLGQSAEPIAITREVRRARAMGVVCVAAAGNDYMSEVSYPARSGVVTAVSAAGVLGAWPQGASTAQSVADDPKPVKDIFFARFSNIGPEIDFIGPGAGIISWVNDKAKGVMDGTSMACPAVVGLIARLLSHHPQILSAERNQQRSDDIIRMANENATPIGFGRVYEGAGLIG